MVTAFHFASCSLISRSAQEKRHLWQVSRRSWHVRRLMKHPPESGSSCPVSCPTLTYSTVTRSRRSLSLNTMLLLSKALKSFMLLLCRSFASHVLLKHQSHFHKTSLAYLKIGIKVMNSILPYKYKTCHPPITSLQKTPSKPAGDASLVCLWFLTNATSIINPKCKSSKSIFNKNVKFFVSFSRFFLRPHFLIRILISLMSFTTQ